MAARPHPITVVGLGPGDARHLTQAVQEVLAGAREVWLRTTRHPAAAALPGGLQIHSCDDIYDREDSFEAVYRAIAARLIEAAQTRPVVYAVPGDPAVGETSVAYLRRAAREAGAAFTVLPGVSFIGPTLAALGWDALDGLQLADATALAARHHPDLDPDRPALVAQVFSRLVATDLKLTLLNQYPAEHPLTLVAGAGTDCLRLATLPLLSLDRRDDCDDLTTIAIPPLAYPGSLLRLADVVARLRAPDGCPWDRAQTHETLRPYLLEETYEALAALDAADMPALAEELGDLLLQIVLHAQLAVEGGEFSLPDVVRAITEKVVRRHPHVFADAHVETAEEVRVSWDALKRRERAGRGEADPFAGIPPDLPALARAQLLQRKAEGHEVPASQGPRVALGALDDDPGSAAARAERIGAALWAIAAVARVWDIDAETALREAALRFVEQVRRSSP